MTKSTCYILPHIRFPACIMDMIIPFPEKRKGTWTMISKTQWIFNGFSMSFLSSDSRSFTVCSGPWAFWPEFRDYLLPWWLWELGLEGFSLQYLDLTHLFVKVFLPLFMPCFLCHRTTVYFTELLMHDTWEVSLLLISQMGQNLNV